LAYAAFLPEAEFEEATDATVWPNYATLRALFFRFTVGARDLSVAPASADAWMGGVGDHAGPAGNPD